MANENVSHIQELVQGQKKSHGTGSRVINTLNNGHSNNRKPFHFPSVYGTKSNQSNNFSYVGNKTTIHNMNGMNGSRPLLPTVLLFSLFKFIWLLK